MTNISASRYISHVRINGNAKTPSLSAAFVGQRGVLVQADCLDLLANVRKNTVDLAFADPPFNLGKTYEDPEITDQYHNEFYRGWCKTWLLELVRVLRPGGALFLYHWPKWLMEFGAWLNGLPDLEFRNWIALKMKNGFPVRNRLHPAHYGLLYYTKSGDSFTFNTVRSKSPACRKCGELIRDYGGYRSKYNKFEQDGALWVRVSDFWDDTRPAIRDKARMRSVNELSVHVPERLLLMASNPGDVVLDCFAGSGSTIWAADRTDRYWIAADKSAEPALKRIASLGHKERTRPPERIAECFLKPFREEILRINPRNAMRPLKKIAVHPVNIQLEMYAPKTKSLGY